MKKLFLLLLLLPRNLLADPPTKPVKPAALHAKAKNPPAMRKNCYQARIVPALLPGAVTPTTGEPAEFKRMTCVKGELKHLPPNAGAHR